MSDSVEKLRLLRLLSEKLLSYTDKGNQQSRDGYYDTPIEGLSVLRSDKTMQPMHRITKPALWVSIQGLKWAVVGEQQFDYSQGNALLITVEVPSRCTIPKATPREPFLGLTLELDRTIFQAVLEKLEHKPEKLAIEQLSNAVVIKLNAQILDCIRRAVALLDTPQSASILYPGIIREISYCLLTGEEAAQALNIAMTGGGYDQRTLEAIRRLRTNFRETLHVEDLAKAAGMSIATFHRHFRATTSLSPLQYQKQLRLLDARRLILTEQHSVGEVANKVGYRSSSQFSREYARMFGKSPRRDR